MLALGLDKLLIMLHHRNRQSRL